MKKRKVFFYFNASLIIGAGHAVRCSVLMQALKKNNWDVYLITSKETLSFMPKLKYWPHFTPEKILCKSDIIVIDNYSLSQVDESFFRNYSKKIIILDDLANKKHDADMVINFCIDNISCYKSLVSDTCQLLLGLSYVLLREEFLYVRDFFLKKRQYYDRHPVRHVLISMGGGNTENATLKALDLLSEVMFLGCVYIISGFYPFNSIVQEQCQKGRLFKCFFYHNVSIVDLLNLFKKVDFVIGAAGYSALERAFLGIPQFVIPICDNQSKIASYFDFLDFPLFWNKINQSRFFSDIEHKIDGLGVNRIIRAINILLS